MTTDHAACEQMIAAAIRTGNTGRAEYLSNRCDRAHGDLTASEQPKDLEESA